MHLCAGLSLRFVFVPKTNSIFPLKSPQIWVFTGQKSLVTTAASYPSLMLPSGLGRLSWDFLKHSAAHKMVTLFYDRLSHLTFWLHRIRQKEPVLKTLYTFGSHTCCSLLTQWGQQKWACSYTDLLNQCKSQRHNKTLGHPKGTPFRGPVFTAGVMFRKVFKSFMLLSASLMAFVDTFVRWRFAKKPQIIPKLWGKKRRKSINDVTKDFAWIWGSISLRRCGTPQSQSQARRPLSQPVPSASISSTNMSSPNT